MSSNSARGGGGARARRRSSARSRILSLIRGSLTVQEKDMVAERGEAQRPARARDRRGRAHGPVLCALPRRAGVRCRGPGSWRRRGGHREPSRLDEGAGARPRAFVVVAAPMPATNATGGAPPPPPPPNVVFDLGSLKSPLRKGLAPPRERPERDERASDVRARHRAAERAPRDLLRLRQRERDRGGARAVRADDGDARRDGSRVAPIG